MIPHYLLWKKLRTKRFTVPVQDVWDTSMKKETDYENRMICRVCMDPADIPISEKIDESSIMSAIRTVANIWVNDSDGLPKYICRACVQELKAALLFKRKCQYTDRKFRETLTEEAFASSPPPIIYNDFAQIIQSMRDQASRRKNQSKSIPQQNQQKQLAKKKKRNEDPNKVYKCKRCDISFNSWEQLKEHRSKRACHCSACPLCGKVVSNIARHKNVVHFKAEKHTCHICGKISFTAGSAKTHLSVHSDKCDFACPMCPYRGKHQAYLTLHMRIHTGERPYLCSKCPAKFVNTSNLKKHQLIHSSKKFQCTRCNKLFRVQKSLDEHFNAAHLHMRYRCSICGRYLWTRRKLLSHEIRVHNREKRKLFSTNVYKVIVNENNE